MFINDITKILKGFVNCFVSVAKARFGSHGKSVQNIYVLGILSLSSSLARSCSHACFRSLTRRRCLKSICGKSKYAQCAVIHSNLRLPLLCRKNPSLHVFFPTLFLSMGAATEAGWRRPRWMSFAQQFVAPKVTFPLKPSTLVTCMSPSWCPT